MKHRIAKRTLGRSRQHRRQMLRNLSHSLIAHGSIVTTEAKGKELKRFLEPVLSVAREELTLHTRRLILSRLHGSFDIELLAETAQRHKGRPGGYLRMTKMPTQRTDGARMVKVEIV